MDTGLHDADPFTVNSNMTYLEPAEVAWHADKLQNASGRRSVLCSHHQLFTAFDTGVGDNAQGRASGINSKLLTAFQPHLKDVAAWFWGHEHNLEVFQPYLGLSKGRCAGASAIPLFSGQDPYQVNTKLDYSPVGQPPALLTGAPQLSVNHDGTYFHAFVLLTLGANGQGTAAYYQIDSTNLGQASCLFEEEIERMAAAWQRERSTRIDTLKLV